MAIDINSLMLQLKPMSMDGSFGNIGQLRLMREQFEETKRRNREDERLRQLAQENEMAQAKLRLQQQREADAAAAQLELDKQRRAVYDDVEEIRRTGDVSAVQALSPKLDALGGRLEHQGTDDEGMPRFRIVPDAAKADAEESARLAQTTTYGEGETAEQSLSRLDAMGYPANETGNLDDPSTVTRSTGLEDAYAQMLSASEYAREHGRPAREADPADLTGAVPRDVIDFGAQRSATLRQLAPYLGAAVDAYPDAAGEDPDQYRRSASRSAEGVAALNLSPADSAKAFNDARRIPDAIIQEQIKADVTAKQKAEAPLSQTDQAALRERGFRHADTTFKSNEIQKTLNSIESADVVVEMLSDDDPYNDEKAINFLMELGRNKGPQTERDALRMTGLSTSSTLDQIAQWLKQKIEGGYGDEVKQSMMGFANYLRGKDTGTVFSWMDSVNEQARKHQDPYAREGYAEYLSSMPKWIVEEYEAQRAADEEGEEEEEPEPTGALAPQRGGPAPIGSVRPASYFAGMSGTEQVPVSGQDSGDFDIELESQAMENDLDPDALARVVSRESGGSASATNPKSGATGIIQFMPKVAKALGTTTKALAAMSATEQLPYAVQYLKGHGIDADSPPEDYVLAVTAPAFIGADDEAVVYRKGSAAWRDNEAWRPADGGDITVADILSFYGLRDKAEGGEASDLPEPANELDQEVLDILR